MVKYGVKKKKKHVHILVNFGCGSEKLAICQQTYLLCVGTIKQEKKYTQLFLTQRDLSEFTTKKTQKVVIHGKM